MEEGVRLHANIGVCPRKMYAITVAEMVEISSGSMDDRDRLNSSISIVNSTPASGALKMPAMAPAAPQPSRTVMWR